ncbi:MAG: Gfo/Idh/MocA family oxidoreductase [Planctomycetota bacterium]|nr:Gfo/Idh/MocA family oxidoreductase [Planctomycetota bacterium]
MIRMGLIGAGLRAGGHLKMLRPLQEAGRVKVSAILDPVAAAREKLARECGAQPVGGMDELLAASDAVIVISPNRFHVEQSIACLEAGKAVYCEKPLALTLADADRVVAAVERTGQAFMTGFSIRWGAPAFQMRQLFAEGKLGELVAVAVRRIAARKDEAERNATGWRADSSQTGGVLAEILAHELDWLRWVGGDVARVTARTYAYHRDHPDANDHVVAQLEFAGGGVGTLEGGWHAYESEYQKSLYGSRTGELASQPVELSGSPSSDEVFVASLEKGEPPPAGAHDGRAVVELTEAILRSAADGRTIQLGD